MSSDETDLVTDSSGGSMFISGRIVTTILTAMAFLIGGPAHAKDDAIARHMLAEAMLAAQFVAAAEKAGMTTPEINAILKDIASRSEVEEFWITDEKGHAYIKNSDLDFTFSPDPVKQPQASAFWPLLTGDATAVIQGPRKREIDEKAFRYVAVSGVDKRRIVQVGVSAENLQACHPFPVTK